MNNSICCFVENILKSTLCTKNYNSRVLSARLNANICLNIFRRTYIYKVGCHTAALSGRGGRVNYLNSFILYFNNHGGTPSPHPTLSAQAPPAIIITGRGAVTSIPTYI